MHRRVTPSIKFADTHLYNREEKGTKCATQPGLEPGQLVPETSALTIRPPVLPHPLHKGSYYRGLVHFVVIYKKCIYVVEDFDNYCGRGHLKYERPFVKKEFHIVVKSNMAE